jgi:hypothetical protein
VNAEDGVWGRRSGRSARAAALCAAALALLAVVLAVASCGGSGTGTSGASATPVSSPGAASKVTNDRYGFSFSYDPKALEYRTKGLITKSQAGKVLFVAEFRDRQRIDGFLTIRVEPNHAGMASRDEMEKTAQALNATSATTGGWVWSVEETGGRPYMTFHGVMEKGPPQIEVQGRRFLGPKYAYTVALMGPTDFMTDPPASLTQILESFRPARF